MRQVEAILLALGSGFCAGALGPAVRRGLHARPDPAAAALATVVIGLAVTAAIAAAAGQLGHVRLRQAWPFLALGALAPGISQVLFVGAIERLGPSRALTGIATTPLFASIAALVLLGEPFGVPLAVGTLLIVLGCATLGWERSRPVGLRPSGFVWVAAAVIAYTTRDDVLRWAGGRSVAPLAATTLLLASAAATVLLYALVLRRGSGPLTAIGQSLLPFAPAGLVFGLAYVALVTAFRHGRVTVVSPVHGMYALWGVLLSAIFLRASELISRSVVAAALLIVCGGALIGIFH